MEILCNFINQMKFLFHLEDCPKGKWVPHVSLQFHLCWVSGGSALVSDMGHSALPTDPGRMLQFGRRGTQLSCSQQHSTTQVSTGRDGWHNHSRLTPWLWLMHQGRKYPLRPVTIWITNFFLNLKNVLLRILTLKILLTTKKCYENIEIYCGVSTGVSKVSPLPHPSLNFWTSGNTSK